MHVCVLLFLSAINLFSYSYIASSANVKSNNFLCSYLTSYK